MGDGMTLNDYQRLAEQTAVYPGRDSDAGLNYCLLGLGGEVGELLNKQKKVLRGDYGDDVILANKHLIKELGDVLWYASQIALELGTTLDAVAVWNLAKLKKRQDDGTLASGAHTEDR